MSGITSTAARCALVTLLSTLGLSESGHAQQTYTEWLNQQLGRVVAVRVNQRSNAKQVEANAAQSTSTALVDQTSASDIIGFALNALGIPRSDGLQDRGTSLTVTPFALVSAFHGTDPMNPAVYDNLTPWLRRIILTLGFEEEAATDTSISDNVTVWGGKVVIWNQRDEMPEAARADLLAALH